MTERQMVEAAAQHVMGWRLIKRAGWSLGMWAAKDGSGARSSWNPLESIADAWMLVDKLHGDGWEATVVRHKRGCTTTFERRGAVERSAEADTAPRAITLAALRARGEARDGKE